MNTTETITGPKLTASLLADALEALARAVEVRCPDGADSPAFGAATEDAANAFGTTPGMARLAADYLGKGRRVLNAVAILGLAERNPNLLALGQRYAARISKGGASDV